jgi:ABC-type branched-subunit amino acid transport system ATPase component
MTAPMLEVERLTVRYGAFVAVREMSLTVHPGQIVGLIGPNGAGKSTVINAVSGAVAPSGGTVTFDGRPTKGLRMDQLSRLGLVRTFQNLEVFPTMTALENVLIRLEAAESSRKLTAEQRAARCHEVLGELGLAAVLLLDEPTAGLAVEERARVVELVTSQMRARGISGVVVEHDMSVVRQMCDDVYVMDAGGPIAHGSFDEIARSPVVREAYLGREAV